MNRFYREHEALIALLAIDECHQMFTCDKFRTHFDAIKNLAHLNKPKNYFSATVPPVLEPHFLRQSYLPNSTIIIRRETGRPNFRYHVLHVEERVRSAVDVAVALAQHLESTTFSPASLGLIFCLSRELVDKIAPFFKGSRSHSGMTTDDREALQGLWNKGDNRWMVATTGWLHGIDNSNVDAVIFIDLPYGLLNFVQGSGRAGRSGQPANIFVLKLQVTYIEPMDEADDVTCRISGNTFLEECKCRRRTISKSMDGKELCCGDIYGALKCDFCNPQHPLVLETRLLLLAPRVQSPDYSIGAWDDESCSKIDEDILTQLPTPRSTPVGPILPPLSVELDHARYNCLIADKRGKVAELSAMTKLLRGYCFVCWAWKGRWTTMTPQHKVFISCKDRSDGYIKHGVGYIRDLKSKFVFERYQNCYTCGLPQGDFTPSTHPSFKPNYNPPCPFEDFVAVLLWFIIHDPEIWRRACVTFFPALKVKMPLDAIVKWFNRVEAPQLFYNGLEVVIWYWLTYKKPRA
jgi:hypothetical protein